MMLSTYEPSVYDGLNASTERALLSEAMPYLPSLGEVILQHGLQDDAAINFLHKHFPLDASERLVEIIQADRTVTRPVDAQGATDAIPYLWKAVEDKHGRLSWTPIEYVASSTLADDAAAQWKRIESSDGFLSELATRLKELDLTDVFGISTLHRGSVLPDKEHVLLERSDLMERTLTLTAMHHSELQPDRDMETVWDFRRDSNGVAANKCRNACLHVNNHH